MNEYALSVRNLSVRFSMRGGRHVAAVTDASFDLAAGECLALVGESGCGKSVLASALLGLLPANAATAGAALLPGGTDLATADERLLARTVRGLLHRTRTAEPRRAPHSRTHSTQSTGGNRKGIDAEAA